MKVRDSGMPNETQWDSFFDTETVLSSMHINAKVFDLVEIGCGYGTFTIPAAKLISGQLFTFDIEDEMIQVLKNKIYQQKISNIILDKRDILLVGTGLDDCSIDYVMLFNIFHHHTPKEFINEAFRILKPNGKIGIIHWRSDIPTPRGPDLSIRPRPKDIIKHFDSHQFSIAKSPFIIKPYHFGIIITKNQKT